VLGRIRSLDRLELAGETIRAAPEALAAAAPQVDGQRIGQIRLPGSETRRKALAVQYGKDGYHLLEAVRAAGAPAWLRELPPSRRCGRSGYSSTTAPVSTGRR